MPRSRNEVRIIGGKWRGRKLSFRGDASLRPTLGRTRETLFNWLRAELPGMTVWDAFAGSGILGFEALSQGAARCLFTDLNRQALDALKANTERLDCTMSAQVQRMDARRLKTPEQGFDLIFLDPPFDQPALLKQTMANLQAQNMVNQYVYAEAASAATLQGLEADSSLTIMRETKAGDAFAALLAAS